MADGQVVLVTTEPLDGSSPVRSVYFVAEQNPETATAIIAAMMAPNEKVEAWGRLPETAVKALGLRPGDFIIIGVRRRISRPRVHKPSFALLNCSASRSANSR